MRGPLDLWSCVLATELCNLRCSFVFLVDLVAETHVVLLQQHSACVQLGISAPQGCGKTTIVAELEALCMANGISAASVSIDDFYLTRHDQQRITDAHPKNHLLAGRGNAGTHDLELGGTTLSQLRKLGCVAVGLWRSLRCNAACENIVSDDPNR